MYLYIALLSPVLYCAVQCCVVLCCVVLCSAVLCCVMLCCDSVPQIDTCLIEWPHLISHPINVCASIQSAHPQQETGHLNTTLQICLFFTSSLHHVLYTIFSQHKNITIWCMHVHSHQHYHLSNHWDWYIIQRDDKITRLIVHMYAIVSLHLTTMLVSRSSSVKSMLVWKWQ